MIEILETKQIKVNKLVNNNGQIEGLPKNPRFIKDDRYKKLVKSLEDNPEMLGARELIVYPYDNNFVIIAGNMRFRACLELGLKEVPCKVLPVSYTVDQLKAITIKYNISYGNDDFDALANEWDVVDLEDWGLDIPQIMSDIDYSILDDEDVSEQLSDMTNGVKKAIQIEFESEHYEEAFELVKFWRDKKAYVGGMIMEYLKAEKEKI
jgi:ParB-like chromosome segregation protein Spo0J